MDSGKDTKTRILDAAEGLFATHGFSATSLRTVTAEAGVNLAAVHYHFGSKEQLIEAVFARRIGPLERRRLQLLEEERRRAAPSPISVDKILVTLIHPVVELARRDASAKERLTSLFGRIHSEPDEAVRRLFLSQFDNVRDRYLAALAEALPQLSHAELTVRFHFAIGAMAAAFADPTRLEHISSGAVKASDSGRVADYLVAFLAAALQAPPLESTEAPARSAPVPPLAAAQRRDR